jgi:CubicO group peptidase (beta-lactamase class C family)
MQSDATRRWSPRSTNLALSLATAFIIGVARFLAAAFLLLRGCRMWIVAVCLSSMLTVAGTTQLAQAQQTSPEIAFRSTTWNALQTELGGGRPPVGWAFVITRNGQEIFVDQGGFSRAPWESRDASLPFTVDTQIFVASVSKTLTNAALMTLAQDRNISLDVFLDMKLREVFPERTFGRFVGNISLRNLMRMRSGLGPVLAAGQPALSSSCIGGKPSFDLWSCLVAGSAGQPGILARDLPCDPQWPTREGPSDHYLNENYLVLRAVVEKLAGQDYCAYVKHRVLNQPGETNITCDSGAIPPVLYYGEDMGPGTDLSGDFRSSAGPVGWYASARELVRFLNSLRSDSILGDDIRQGMFTQKILMLKIHGKGGTFWEKSGGWTAGGTARACIARFPSGVDAALVMNSSTRLPCAVIAHVYEATLPVLTASAKDFIQSTTVTMSSPLLGSNMLPAGEIRFTTDGTEPSATSQLWAGAPITLTQTGTIKASIFDHQALISGPAEITVNGPLMPEPSVPLLKPGVHWQIFDHPDSACWNELPDLSRLTEVHHGINAKPGTAFNLSALLAAPNESFAAEFDGFLYAPADDVYTFGLPAETRSRLVIGDRIVVGPDLANIGSVALKKGLHSIKVQYLNQAEPSELKLEWSRTGDPGMHEVPSAAVSTSLAAEVPTPRGPN